MKTTQAIKTLAAFCDQSHLSAKHVRAVVRQLGGWEAFTSAAPDISSHGIDGGFHGFIYHRDTEAFAKHNREEIARMASEQAQDFGTPVTEMIQGFGCFRHGTKPTDEEIGRALYAGRNLPDGVNMLNALAWYAGEEVARSYTDLAERD